MSTRTVAEFVVAAGTLWCVGRLWIRWIGLAVFVVVLVVAFVNLGEWQLRRLEQRQARNAVVMAHQNNPVIPLSARGYGPVADADQWQRVELTGTFDPDHQLQVRYRNNNDQPGIEILTPLRTTDGQVVLIDRGFIPRSKGEPPPDALPAPPTGVVTVMGHLRRSENGPDAAINPGGNAVRLINAPAVGAWLGTDVMDGYVGLLTVSTPQTADLEPVQTPTLDEGPHFWYAVQWFMFVGFAVVGLVVFVRGDLKDRRKVREADGGAASSHNEDAAAEIAAGDRVSSHAD